MEYLVEGTKYSLSYSELKEEYHKHICYTDDEFMKNLPSALHLACIIGYLKEIPSYLCLSDKGIVHELTHLLCFGEKEPTTELKTVRELFREQLKL